MRKTDTTFSCFSSVDLLKCENMIVHFSASFGKIEENILAYRAILDAIRQEGHNIAVEWVETGWMHKDDPQLEKQKLDWSTFATNSRLGIDKADMVIVEASGFSGFGVGYEAAYAVQIKKPTLVLVSKEYSQKSYAIGLADDFLTVQTYEKTTLTKIVERFLREHSIKSKDLRFNFAIDSRIYNHLRRKSHETGKTKAEILRDLLLKDIGETY